MPPITQVQRSKVNHELKRLGFTGINDPNLFAQIGTLYTTHESFRGLLMSTAQDQRRIAYDAIKPHLCFVAKSLDTYEREIHEKAEREQWDVFDPNNPHFPRAFQVSDVKTEESKPQMAEHVAKVVEELFEGEEEAEDPAEGE